MKENQRLGKICEKHPELGGLRYVRNSTCVACQREFERARKKYSPQARERIYERNAEKRARKLEFDRILDRTRLMAQQIASARGRELGEKLHILEWRDYWADAVVAIRELGGEPHDSPIPDALPTKWLKPPL